MACQTLVILSKKSIFMASNFFMQMFNVSELCMQIFQMAILKALVQVEFPVHALSTNN